MATNFLVSLPQVQKNLNSLSTSAYGDVAVTKTSDLFGGYRYQTHSGIVTLTSTRRIDMQFGVAHKADHIIIAGFREVLVNDGDVDVFVWHSSDGVSYTNVVNQTVTSADLVGVDNKSAGNGSEDWVFEFTEAENTYWRISLIPSATTFMQLSKIYLGKWLDLGEPALYRPQIESVTGYESEDGSAAMRLTEGSLPLTYQIEWANVTDAQLESPNVNFFAEVLEHVGSLGCYGAFLYTKTDNRLLQGESLRHVEVTGAKVTKVFHNCNRVTMTVREMRS